MFYSHPSTLSLRLISFQQISLLHKCKYHWDHDDPKVSPSLQWFEISRVKLSQFSLTFLQIVNFPWHKIKFFDFSHTLKNIFFPDHFLACGNPVYYLPSLTGDDTSPLFLPHSIQSSRLPPLVITGIGHVKNIAIFETETLAGETAVLRFVVVKQGPEQKAYSCYLLLRLELYAHKKDVL